MKLGNAFNGTRIASASSRLLLFETKKLTFAPLVFGRVLQRMQILGIKGE